ncbi:hypothetical protein AEMCBJ_15050 [Cupriavidus necator]|uniref:capsular polysaccharide export protein, LipB/KpsS family n=1 Tax=Cupriavidus necator TaxID=106590 RepID=UPI003F737332
MRHAEDFAARDFFGEEPSPAPNDKLLIVTACDSAYINYAFSLINSIEKFSPGFPIHLHIVNPEGGLIEKLTRARETLDSCRLTYSWEQTDLARLTLEQRRSYYASARFLALQQWLPVLSLPVLCLDADSLVINPIDFDFTDKRDVDVCLVRRDLGNEKPAEHLSVATGTIWINHSNGAKKLISAIADELRLIFAQGEAGWFVDQVSFFRQMTRLASEVQVLNIKRKYADWEFRADSIVWAGKGDRKKTDFRFSLLGGLLSSDQNSRRLAQTIGNDFRKLVDVSQSDPFDIKIRSLLVSCPAGASEVNRALTSDVGIFIPRLDLPWKKPKNENDIPIISQDALALRLRWKEFAIRLANFIENAGGRVKIIEIPAWEIDAAMIDRANLQLALVPHRCELDFERGRTPVLFYMQEFFRSVFVVDPKGWSAASSVYPVNECRLPDKNAGLFDAYRKKAVQGNLASKFDQRRRSSYVSLLLRRQIPTGKYIFFPLQVPHDQSIKYFSPLTEEQVLDALISWAAQRRVTVVLKPHPANPKAMERFRHLRAKKNVWWTEANVHDLITNAAAIYTINSGVGFESLFLSKPVVTFGRVEYDCVTFKARLSNLDEAWSYCLSASRKELENRYRRFVDWFLGCHAIDLASESASARRLREVAQKIVMDLRIGEACDAKE